MNKLVDVNKEAMSQEYSELQTRVAKNIVESLRQENHKKGTHLKEQDLANSFQVSRSPIRGALNFLTDNGIVERIANRGYFLACDATSISLSDLEISPTSDEKVCEQIAKDWFHGKVPEVFTEAEFRRRYDLGRLSLSRILVKLSEEGVISRNQGHGWRFEPTLNTEEQHDASFEFRQVVEPASIMLPTFELDKGLAAASRHHHQEILNGNVTDIARIFEIDADFHKMLALSCKNPFFVSAIERQSNLRRLVEYESLIKTDRLIKSSQEHMDILDAIEVGDFNLASILLKQHIMIAGRCKPAFD
ncbi:GntR family transcriptional regulator [Amphritea sp. HPY]|uniref:GntR family transcriptional regulator n=1 Tax=Amphritea sp. HPY TaxID=3421652 RepID=UPI003D7E2150